MYRDRGGGSSKSEIVGGPLDRKRINDALDKHLEKSTPSTSRAFKDKAIPSTSAGSGAGKSHQQHLDHRATKNKCSDGKALIPFSLGKMFFLLIFYVRATKNKNYFIVECVKFADNPVIL